MAFDVQLKDLNCSIEKNAVMITRGGVSTKVPLHNIINIKNEYFRVVGRQLVPIHDEWAPVHCDVSRITLFIYDQKKKETYTEILISDDMESNSHLNIFAHEIRFRAESVRRGVTNALNSNLNILTPDEIKEVEEAMRLWEPLYAGDGTGAA